MRSKVADKVRELQQQEMLALTPGERIRVAFELGEVDIRLYAAASGLTIEDADTNVRRERQSGRTRPSRVKAG